MNAIEEAYLRMKQEELEEKAKCSTKEDASNDKSDDGEGLDKADPKAAKKDFKDRKDKDIDNDGDVDDSDEYLHKKRKAISKEIEKESVEVDAGILEAFAIIAEATAKKEAIEIDDEDGEVTKKDDDKKKKPKKGEEEVVDDTVNEISKKTLGSYVKKASQSAASANALKGTYATTAARAKSSAEQETMRKKSRDMQKKGDKRRAGINKAVNKLAKEDKQIDELKARTVGSYIRKATNDLTRQKSGQATAAKHNKHQDKYSQRGASPAMKSMEKEYERRAKKREAGLAKADRALARKESYEANNAKWKDWVDGLKEGAYKEADKKVHSPNATGKEMLEPRAKGEKDFKDNHNIEVFDRVPKDDQGITANVPSRKLRPGDNDKGDTKVVKAPK